MISRFVSLTALTLVAMGTSCGADHGERVAPQIRMLNQALLSELTAFHVRIFPASATLRCNAAMGHVLINGRRDLAGLPGRAVQPAERCGADWSRLQAMYGTATPVDQCMQRQATVSIAPGSYLVLVHGQGTFRRPTGETRSGIRGSGCAEVTLTAGATNELPILMVEQSDDRAVCGDGLLDSNETCDAGTNNGMEGSGCSAQCQTLEVQVNNNTRPAMNVGNQHHPSVAWSVGGQLIVAFDVDGAPEQDTRVRYFDAEGAAITSPASLAEDMVLGGGMSQQLRPSIAPTSTPRGYVAAWRTLVGRTVQVQSNDEQAIRDTTPPRYVPVPVGAVGPERFDPAVAASASRVLVAWREGDGAAASVRAITLASAMPLAAPPTMPAAAMVASGVVSSPRATALRDGTFVVVWSLAGEIFARRISATGVPMGDAVLINPVSAQVQDQPSIAAYEDGAIIAWRDAATDNNDNSGTSIRWARVGAMLQRVGDLHTAPTTTAGDQAAPSVAVGAGPNPVVLVVWQDEMSGHIRGRLSRGDGSEVFSRIGASTADFQISLGGEGPRIDPSASAGGAPLARFAVAWEGTAVGGGTDVMMRLFPQ
jgi:cysteine-rich repeat protein